MFFPLEFQILALALLAALGWSAALQVLAWSGVDARQALQLAQLPAGNAEPGDGGLSRGVARLAAALALLSAAGWLLSACSPAPGVRTGIALLTYLALLAALAQPRRALCRAVRMQLAGLLARIVKPSLSDPVCLADIIMADALTSCSRMLADAAVVACQFGALLWRSGHACSGAGVAGALLASAPFAFRLRQCVNEYLKAPAGSPDARRHLANAIKYASSFPVIALAAARPQAVAAAAHPGWAPQTVLFLWVAAATANSLYSFYWDVAFDWDLGHTHSGWKLADLVVPAGCAASPGVPDPPAAPPQPCSFPRLLRPRLCFASHSVYYAAIATDLVLRMAWTLRLGSVARIDSLAYGGFLLSALELYRRWQWSILRIEKEAAAL
ncbi:protein-ER retention protein [Coemansia nantahalensis]|uniref:Protein-ER retention protein n=1 Tax=Coemansia nantahalensis TaxID=2789366 RepID=A0ACC1K1T1_9FUNG|nr:protein-ER retention protein [Coemansia nantahalensis]KAJ2771696.1 protein-ER retention protein [Coemansia nantahalensis]